MEIYKGIDLPDDYIERMNRQRIYEYGTNTKNFRKYEQESTFFFLKDGDIWQSFGMLKPVTITYQEQEYPILGIGNIISVIKGEGHGKRLMTFIKNYLQEANMAGVGFCTQDNTAFYRKCGYHVEPDISTRFRYPAGDNEAIGMVVDVLCSNPQFIDTLNTSDDLIYVNVPYW